jgi:hypothetical protein
MSRSRWPICIQLDHLADQAEERAYTSGRNECAAHVSPESRLSQTVSLRTAGQVERPAINSASTPALRDRRS